MIARLNLIVVNVSLAAVGVAVFQWLLGFPPLILFIVPVAIVFRISGFAGALTAAVIGAVVGDYFFVAPLGYITVHAQGLRLLLLLLLGAGMSVPWRRRMRFPTGGQSDASSSRVEVARAPMLLRQPSPAPPS